MKLVFLSGQENLVTIGTLNILVLVLKIIVVASYTSLLPLSHQLIPVLTIKVTLSVQDNFQRSYIEEYISKSFKLLHINFRSDKVNILVGGNWKDTTHRNVGSHGDYWPTVWYSSSLALNLYFNSNEVVPPGLGDLRYIGRSIRSVQ